MESRSPNVVLRAVVVPALGVSLSALLAVGCNREGSASAERSAVPGEMVVHVDGAGVPLEAWPMPGPPANRPSEVPLTGSRPQEPTEHSTPHPRIVSDAGSAEPSATHRVTPGPPPPQKNHPRRGQMPLLGLKSEQAPKVRTARRTRGNDEGGKISGLAGARWGLR